jgi:hypothetical protein
MTRAGSRNGRLKKISTSHGEFVIQNAGGMSITVWSAKQEHS